MLKLAHCAGELRYSQVMNVYLEDNLAKAGGSYGPALLEKEQEFFDYLRQVFFRTSGAVCAIWEERGVYRSALRLEPYRDGLLMAGLETAPEHRRKGYARCLVEAVLAEFGDQTIYSHIARDNLPSIRLHERTGFRKIRDGALCIDGSMDPRMDTYVYENTATGR